MDLPRGGDADAGDAGALGGVQQLGDDALEVGEDAGGALPGLGLRLDAGHELARFGKKPAAQLAAAEIDPYGVAVSGHRVRRRERLPGGGDQDFFSSSFFAAGLSSLFSSATPFLNSFTLEPSEREASGRRWARTE